MHGFRLQSYTIVYHESFFGDFKNIREAFFVYSQSEEATRALLEQIFRAIEIFENPVLNGFTPMNNVIAQKGYEKFPILGGRYLLYFKTDKVRRIRKFYYLKSAKTEYDEGVFV